MSVTSQSLVLPGGQSKSSSHKGMGGHHTPNKGAKDEWLTPPHVIDSLGPFDLDPCAPVIQPWPTARRAISLPEDGLAAEWSKDEFVWCNPPYGPATWGWLARLSEHPAGGIALIFARTETAGFFREVWKKADCLLFLEGRLFFHHVDGVRAGANAGAPSVLVGYGALASDRLKYTSLPGKLVWN